MNCTQCHHPEADHGPTAGRWQNPDTGEWDRVIPGRLCFYMENQGYQQDLCDCPGFDSDGLVVGPSAFAKAGLGGPSR